MKTVLFLALFLSFLSAAEAFTRWPAADPVRKYATVHGRIRVAVTAAMRARGLDELFLQGTLLGIEGLDAEIIVALQPCASSKNIICLDYAVRIAQEENRWVFHQPMIPATWIDEKDQIFIALYLPIYRSADYERFDLADLRLPGLLELESTPLNLRRVDDIMKWETDKKAKFEWHRIRREDAQNLLDRWRAEYLALEGKNVGTYVHRSGDWESVNVRSEDIPQF